MVNMILKHCRIRFCIISYYLKSIWHVDAFNDPLIDNKDSKKRYGADVLIEDHIAKIG